MRGTISMGSALVKATKKQKAPSSIKRRRGTILCYLKGFYELEI
jgi:hypothetical protein